MSEQTANASHEENRTTLPNSDSGSEVVPVDFSSDAGTAMQAGTSITQDRPLRTASRHSIRAESLRRLERRHSGEQRQQRQQDQVKQPWARSRVTNPPVDLRLLDYVSEYDENLNCPICRCPFIDPIMLLDCDHYFCRDCIRQSWRSSSAYTPLAPRGDCPSCRTPAKFGPQTATSKILVNIVGELVVKCPNEAAGCKAQVKRGEVQDHVDIYCGFTLVECATEECAEPVRRKDIDRGCLHYSVSCLGCRAEMQQWLLETHWQKECPDREVSCRECGIAVPQLELEEHDRLACPARLIPCSGHIFGCTSRSLPAELPGHEQTCVLARLAPAWKKQQQRLDEQEAAQKHLNRKLAVLEDGFATFRSILQPPRSRNSQLSPVTSRATDDDLLRSLASPGTDHHRLERRVDREADHIVPTTSSSGTEATFRATADETPSIAGARAQTERGQNEAFYAPPLPLPLELPQTNISETSPYTSPLHHLLSLHESLRDEVARVSATLSQLEGRTSMQILNENLRTRDDLSYLGAQVAALQRQVHWLTSSQLQRIQQHQQSGSNAGGGRVGGSNAAAGSSSSTAGDGVEGVVDAVSSAATALRGAARMMGVGGGHQQQGDQGIVAGIRRRASEEGRTKL